MLVQQALYWMIHLLSHQTVRNQDHPPSEAPPTACMQGWYSEFDQLTLLVSSASIRTPLAQNSQGSVLNQSPRRLGRQQILHTSPSVRQPDTRERGPRHWVPTPALALYRCQPKRTGKLHALQSHLGHGHIWGRGSMR